MESKAIHSVFGDCARTVRVQSTKSMIGHTLGAAGALESIAALAAMEEGFIHPTINYETPDPECDLRIASKTEEARVDRILVNNFGFGGHNAVLALQRHE
jgi:3-oxoacyl-[acyl-carrier-protein] synthase II